MIFIFLINRTFSYSLDRIIQRGVLRIRLRNVYQWMHASNWILLITPCFDFGILILFLRLWYCAIEVNNFERIVDFVLCCQSWSYVTFSLSIKNLWHLRQFVNHRIIFINNTKHIWLSDCKHSAMIWFAPHTLRIHPHATDVLVTKYVTWASISQTYV